MQPGGLEPPTCGSVDRRSKHYKHRPEQDLTEDGTPVGSAKGSAPPTPEQLRRAIERVNDLIAARRISPDHVAGLLLLDPREDGRPG